MDSDQEESRRYERDLFGDEDDDNTSVKSEDNDKDGGRAANNHPENDSGSGDERQDPDQDGKDKGEEKEKVKPKKRGPVKRILLNEDVLCGKNGLIKIEGIFKDFKFEGKGREQQDLDRMLHKLEHWVHIMYPRHPFGQTLERIEFLGIKKRPVKTYLKKIRMGLVSATEKEEDFLNLGNEVSSDEDGAIVEGMESTTADDRAMDSPQHLGGMSDDEFPDDFPTLPMDMEEFMEAAVQDADKLVVTEMIQEESWNRNSSELE